MLAHCIVKYYRAEALAKIDLQKPNTEVAVATRAVVSQTLEHLSELLMTRLAELASQYQDYSGLRTSSAEKHLKEITTEEQVCLRQQEMVDDLQLLFEPGHQMVKADMVLLNRCGVEGEGDLKRLMAYWSKDSTFRMAVNSTPGRPSISGNITPPVKKPTVDADFPDWDYAAAGDKRSFSPMLARSSIS